MYKYNKVEAKNHLCQTIRLRDISLCRHYVSLNFIVMADLHDIIAFSSEGEKILGVVIEHYTNPLDDFYVVYADYALHKVCNSNEDASIIFENVIIPSCDAAIADYKLKMQHLKDIDDYHKDIQSLREAILLKIDPKSLFKDNKAE